MVLVGGSLWILIPTAFRMSLIRSLIIRSFNRAVAGRWSALLGVRFPLPALGEGVRFGSGRTLFTLLFEPELRTANHEGEIDYGNREEEHCGF